MLSGVGTSPIERGRHLSTCIETAFRSGRHTPDTMWLFESLEYAGLRILWAEAPLVSFTRNFATFIDLLCTTRDGTMVVVEVKRSCGGVSWMCGCLGTTAHEHGIHNSEKWFHGDLEGIQGCALGKATAQAKLEALVLHEEYGIPKHRLLWMVAVFCGTNTSVCIVQGKI